MTAAHPDCVVLHRILLMALQGNGPERQHRHEQLYTRLTHICVSVCESVYVTLAVWDGGGCRLVTAGVAVGNRPHRVSSIIMRADEKVSRTFPHQTLQLLQGISHTAISGWMPCWYCNEESVVSEIQPVCPGRAALHGGCSDPRGPPGLGCSQSESFPPAEDAPEEIPLDPKTSHTCNPPAG